MATPSLRAHARSNLPPLPAHAGRRRHGRDLLRDSAALHPAVMSQLQVVKYDAGRKREWDDFVARAKNGVFLFQRDYMEYHADRFTDASLLVFDEASRLVALLPASLRDDVLSSHGGLTFGGFITDERMKAALMVEVFDAARAHMRERGVAKFIYKA